MVSASWGLLFNIYVHTRARARVCVCVCGFPGGSEGKESACNVGDLGLILGQEDPLEKGMVTHSSFLAWKNPIDRGAWWATVHGVTKS